MKEDAAELRPLNKIIADAKRMKNIKKGLVLCENCNNPASLSLSQSLSWTACAPCVWGESDSLDPEDFIAIPMFGVNP